MNNAGYRRVLAAAEFSLSDEAIMLAHRVAAPASEIPHDLPIGPRRLLGRLQHLRQSFAARQRLIREGERQANCFVILSGLVHRHRVTSDGQRQITGVYVPGDIAGLGGAVGGESRHSIEAAGVVTVAAIGVTQLAEAARQDAVIAGTLWREAQAEAAATGEWVVNIGRRTARERILNLFCELSLRLERAGVSARHAFVLPLTQADLADATGLTAVHVNRVIRTLELDGTIERHGRAITLNNWDRIAGMADFEPGQWARPPEVATH